MCRGGSLVEVGLGILAVRQGSGPVMTEHEVRRVAEPRGDPGEPAVAAEGAVEGHCGWYGWRPRASGWSRQGLGSE